MENVKTEFLYNEDNFRFTPQMKEAFDECGYVIIRNVLRPAEIEKVKTAVSNSNDIQKFAYGIPDDQGGRSRLCLWNHPGNDITGMVARCEKVAGVCEKLLGGEVYHYHTKLMMKDAFTGGKFSWHQDYGYWYQNGCLYPDMMTVFLPVDECNKDNGCLQILRGSHKCGRIEHTLIGGQTGADLERVAELKKRHPLEFVEMRPGDGLYFHCNLLHTSSPNTSPNRRWAFLVAYNRASNDPVYQHHCPCYTPLHKVPDSAVIECNDVNMSGKDFLDPNKDKTVQMKQ